MTDSTMRRLSRRSAIAVASATLGAFAVVRAPARAAAYDWKFGTDFGRDHPMNVRAVEAFSKIRRESGGRLDIKAYPNGMLGGAPALVTQVRLGAIEMVAVGGGVLDPLSPVAQINLVPFGFRDKRTAYAALDGDLGRLIRDQFPPRGLHPFEVVYDSGFRHFTTGTKPIKTIDDVQGLKLRISPGNLYYDTFHSLGTSPVTLAPSEVYTALQTHVVDSQETPLPLMESLRYYEVQKYCSLSSHIWSPTWLMVNREKWDALPRDLQDITQKHVNAGALLQRKDSEILERSLRDKLQRLGLKFNTVDTSGFKTKLTASGFYGRWRKEFGAPAWSVLEKYTGPLA